MDTTSIGPYILFMNDAVRFLEPDQFIHKLSRIFANLKSRISEKLPASNIDHVGSSAIKGAISKGDLDILVRVDIADLERGISALQELGFTVKQGTLRTESLCMLVTTEFSEDVAVQLVAQGSEFENFIIFRDRLNTNPDLVKQYNQLKLESAGLSAADYRTRKSKFIQRVLAD